MVSGESPCLAYVAVFMLYVISTNARRGHLLKTGATWGRDGSLIMDFSQECFYLATLEDASWLKRTIMTRAKSGEPSSRAVCCDEWRL